MRYASLFSGAGGTDSGATQAGLLYQWGIERNKLKWQVNRINFPNRCILADVRAVCPTALEPIDVLWASPPCQHASQARRTTVKTDHQDRFIGNEIPKYLKALMPAWFFLENVPLYQNEPSFLKALDTLDDEYQYRWEVLDLADYGIPMNRKRLILIANRVNAPIRFPEKRPQRGWWNVICPVWDNLDEVLDFPKWQQDSINTWAKRRDDEMQGEWRDRIKGYVVNSQNMSKPPQMKLTVRRRNAPVFTLTCAHSRRACYAYSADTVRRLDAKTWARLMTLPVDFHLPLCYGQAVQCIGDMVPPMFVKQLMEVNGIDSIASRSRH